MAHCYSHLFGIATTGLRFFTVYGPWGRPDMAPFKFVEAIERDEVIDLYNYGRMQRDFTYVDDIVEGLVRVIDRPHEGYRLYNVGHGSPVGLLEFVHTVEKALGKRARKRFLPIPPGDVVATHAEVEDFFRYTGFHPATPVALGVERLVAWYRDYAHRDYVWCQRAMA
jgi:UDP-glucuronate 4-epimerase